MKNLWAVQLLQDTPNYKQGFWLSIWSPDPMGEHIGGSFAFTAQEAKRILFEDEADARQICDSLNTRHNLKANIVLAYGS